MNTAIAKNKEFIYKFCRTCGTKFKTKRPLQSRFCSDKCRTRNRRIEIRWQKWKNSEEGKIYFSKTCAEREREELAAMGIKNENQ
jgi:hypothetical protein